MCAAQLEWHRGAHLVFPFSLGLPHFRRFQCDIEGTRRVLPTNQVTPCRQHTAKVQCRGSVHQCFVLGLVAGRVGCYNHLMRFAAARTQGEPKLEAVSSSSSSSPSITHWGAPHHWIREIYCVGVGCTWCGLASCLVPNDQKASMRPAVVLAGHLFPPRRPLEGVGTQSVVKARRAVLAAVRDSKLYTLEYS